MGGANFSMPGSASRSALFGHVQNELRQTLAAGSRKLEIHQSIECGEMVRAYLFRDANGGFSRLGHKCNQPLSGDELRSACVDGLRCRPVWDIEQRFTE